MNEQAKIDLLAKIELTNSKQWTTHQKQDIFKTCQTDKQFLNKVRLAFITKQLKEVENDVLENKVINDNSELVGSRDWECCGQNCSYKYFRGNAQKLKIEVRPEDNKTLVGKNYVCLKHYCVKWQDNDYCQNYFKLHKKLPEGAFLKIKLSNSNKTQPEKSLVTKPKTTLLNHVLHNKEGLN